VRDLRYDRLAELVLDHSLGLKAGEVLRIEAEAVAAPLILPLHREAIKRGAHAYTALDLAGLNELLVAHGSGLRPNLQTTPAGGHSYFVDAQPTVQGAAEYGPTAVWEGGGYGPVSRGRQVRHQTHSGTQRGAAADPDLMHGGVHALPPATALPVQAPLPLPAPVVPVPVSPADLDLSDDILAEK